MPKEVDALLAKATPQARALAAKTRALVLREFPEAFEQVRGGWNAVWYGVGPKMYEQVFVIHPQKDYVNLAFALGTELSDPKGILEGTGKSIRHVKVTGERVLKAPELRALIREAIGRGGMGKDRRGAPKKQAVRRRAAKR